MSRTSLTIAQSVLSNSSIPRPIALFLALSLLGLTGCAGGQLEARLDQAVEASKGRTGVTAYDREPSGPECEPNAIIMSGGQRYTIHVFEGGNNNNFQMLMFRTTPGQKPYRVHVTKIGKEWSILTPSGRYMPSGEPIFYRGEYTEGNRDLNNVTMGAGNGIRNLDPSSPEAAIVRADLNVAMKGAAQARPAPFDCWEIAEVPGGHVVKNDAPSGLTTVIFQRDRETATVIYKMCCAGNTKIPNIQLNGINMFGLNDEADKSAQAAILQTLYPTMRGAWSQDQVDLAENLGQYLFYQLRIAEQKLRDAAFNGKPLGNEHDGISTERGRKLSAQVKRNPNFFRQKIIETIQKRGPNSYDPYGRPTSHNTKMPFKQSKMAARTVDSLVLS